MRPILHGDVNAAARCLALLDARAQSSAIAEMLYRAHCADRFRKRTGLSHPAWGNGSLVMAAGTGWTEPRRAVTETEYLRALSVVALGILDWRRNPARRTSARAEAESV
jgi:hypothetical protein